MDFFRIRSSTWILFAVLFQAPFAYSNILQDIKKHHKYLDASQYHEENFKNAAPGYYQFRPDPSSSTHLILTTTGKDGLVHHHPFEIQGDLLISSTDKRQWDKLEPLLTHYLGSGIEPQCAPENPGSPQNAQLHHLTQLTQEVSLAEQKNHESASSSSSPNRLSDLFHRGDFLYGLENETRVIYKLDIPKDSAVTIDKLNNKLEFLFADSKESLKKEFKDRFPEQSDENSRLEAFASFLLDHRILKKSEDEDETAFIRKACKAGILFTIERGHKIHFLLDALDLQRVATKRKSAERKGVRSLKKTPVTEVVEDHSFTGSELRYLHLLYKENPKWFKDQVVFYRNGIRVPAPWEENPSLWSQSKSVEKLND